jgi:hypothetical protein
MQPVILPLVALALLASTETPQRLEATTTTQPDIVSPAVQPPALSAEQCRDRITLAREASGKPPLLEREPASAEKPYRIYAVDKRVNGCAVMVMHGDVSDIRPLPARPEGSILLIPAKSAQ